MIALLAVCLVALALLQLVRQLRRKNLKRLEELAPCQIWTTYHHAVLARSAQQAIKELDKHFRLLGQVPPDEGSREDDWLRWEPHHPFTGIDPNGDVLSVLPYAWDLLHGPGYLATPRRLTVVPPLADEASEPPPDAA